MFKAGDIVSFICKDGSFGIAKLLCIDDKEVLPVSQRVFHFLIYKEKFALPPSGVTTALTPYISHLPVMENVVSGCMFVKWEEVNQVKEMESYRIWISSFFKGESGIFDLPLDDAISLIIEASKFV